MYFKVADPAQKYTIPRPFIFLCPLPLLFTPASFFLINK